MTQLSLSPSESTVLRVRYRLQVPGLSLTLFLRVLVFSEGGMPQLSNAQQPDLGWTRHWYRMLRTEQCMRCKQMDECAVITFTWTGV